MQEVEVKILNINRKHTEKTLLSFGAKKVFDDVITTILFDFSDASIKKAKNLIRLRRVGTKSFLTFKKFVEHAQLKVRSEFEVEVSDFDTMHTILCSLGLHPELQIKKHRVSYVIGDVHFEFDKHLDEYSFIPEFLEIEAKDEEAVFRYVKLLGYTKSQCKPWGFFELVEYYKKRRSIPKRSDIL
jgi:predicted adenylyl cyclase CyaB